MWIFENVGYANVSLQMWIKQLIIQYEAICKISTRSYDVSICNNINTDY